MDSYKRCDALSKIKSTEQGMLREPMREGRKKKTLETEVEDIRFQGDPGNNGKITKTDLEGIGEDVTSWKEIVYDKRR